MRAPPVPLQDGFEPLPAQSHRVPRRLQIVLLAVVVIVGGVVGVRWLTSSSHPPRITVYGQSVADPAGVLDAAQQQFVRYAAAEHAALGADAKCWFERPAGSPDIGSVVLCGPVQFFGNETGALYLRYALSARGTNPVHLSTDSRPASAEPVAAAPGTTLVRPDRTSDPDRTADFAAPVPPAAAPDTLTMTDAVVPAELTPAPAKAVIGSDTITVRLTAYGPVSDFGTGGAARSAPDGGQLYAFRLAFSGGENGFARLEKLHLGVSVGGAPPRPLHLPDHGVQMSGQLFAVSTPAGARLELELTEHGITQRLSLRDGTPAAGNIAYLPMYEQVEARPVQRIARATLIRGAKRTPTTLYIDVLSGFEEFFPPGTNLHPKRNDHVFLSFGLSYWFQQVSGRQQFSTADVTVTPAGGSPIRPEQFDTPDWPVFDVPANMTRATITIRGSDFGTGYGVSLRHPVELPLRLEQSTA